MLRSVTASIAIAAWCLLAGSAAPVVSSAPIRIGASLSLTGSYAALGQNQHRGYQLCVEHANRTGGVLGRPLDLLIQDDRSDPTTAARLYERLITDERVDAVLGPYSSDITEAVADINERHRMPMVAPMAASTEIFRKGRRFVFMVQSPAGVYFEGLIDLAIRMGLRTAAFIHQETLFPESAVRGAVALAKARGLRVVFVGSYAREGPDFDALVADVRAATPDLLGAGTFFEDAVAITRRLKALDVNPKMFGVTVGGDLPKFYETLGRDAEFVYGASQWLPELVSVRAGGLVPISRHYPGAKAFTDAYRQRFSAKDLAYHAAGGYAGCQILVEAIKRAGSLDGERVREAIAGLDLNTVYGGFRVDGDGAQVSHKMVTFQWQDGQKVIVWPTELTPRKPRFPTPPWSARR